MFLASYSLVLTLFPDDPIFSLLMMIIMLESPYFHLPSLSTSLTLPSLIVFNQPLLVILLVLQALQSMHEDIPLLFCSRLANWQVEAGILTYKGHVYVPTDDFLHHSILECCHNHETARHSGSLKTVELANCALIVLSHIVAPCCYVLLLLHRPIEPASPMSVPFSF